jgi:hypothetical protein
VTLIGLNIIMNKSKRNFVLAGAVLLAAVILGAVGCESFDGSASGSLASVTILNRPMADVQAAVTNVFTAHAFAGGSTGTNQFTFHRAGSSMDMLAYGSYMFQHPISVKVVVTTRQRAPDVIAVGCNAWIIEAENDPVFQEIHPVSSLRKGPYEDLLNEVKTRLGQ